MNPHITDLSALTSPAEPTHPFINLIMSIVRYLTFVFITYGIYRTIMRLQKDSQKPSNFVVFEEAGIKPFKAVGVNLLVSIFTFLLCLPVLILMFLFAAGFTFASSALHGPTLFSGLIAIAAVLLFVWAFLAIYARYSQAMFYYANDSSLGVMESIKLSRQSMRGRWLEYIVLILSFIPWWFSCILVIPCFYVFPYYWATLVEYFRRVSATGNFVDGKVVESSALPQVNNGSEDSFEIVEEDLTDSN